MKFSQRIGKTPVRTLLQIDDIDAPLRNRLWTIILDEFINQLHHSQYGLTLDVLYTGVWIDLFKRPIDTIPHYQEYYFSERKVRKDEVLGVIRDWYFTCEWYEVYDFVEYLSKSDNAFGKFLNFDGKCNFALKTEMSGFRVVEGNVVQITSDEEIKEIEEALSDTGKWNSVNTHLSTALKFLADRKVPDYRNSIKESISAVEALCVIITHNPKATLGEALSEIEKKHSFHSALKKSFSSLYGYTSDASGIRHSLTEHDNAIDFEEAKFMLVSCSAFINFLKSRYTS